MKLHQSKSAESLDWLKCSLCDLQEKSHLPVMHVICASFSATTWTDTRGCTAERSRTSVIAAIRLAGHVFIIAPLEKVNLSWQCFDQLWPKHTPLFARPQNFSRTDRLLRHRRLCTVGVSKEENQYSQDASAHPASWSPLQPSNNRLTVWHRASNRDPTDSSSLPLSVSDVRRWSSTVL